MATAGLTRRFLPPPPSPFARAGVRARVDGIFDAPSFARDGVTAGDVRFAGAFATRVDGDFRVAPVRDVRVVDTTFFGVALRTAALREAVFFDAGFCAGVLRAVALAAERDGALRATRRAAGLFVAVFFTGVLRVAARFVADFFAVAAPARFFAAAWAGVARLAAAFFADAFFAADFFDAVPAARLVAGFALRDAVGLMGIS